MLALHLRNQLRSTIRWLGLAALWISSSVAAQPSAAVEPAAESSALQQLQAAVAAQQQENARQQRELDALQAQQASADISDRRDSSELSEFDPSFRLYGFADTGLQKIWGGFFDRGLAQSDAANFVLGNVNVYFDATPLENLRFLSEVRFTTLPNGSEVSDLATGNAAMQNTAVFDQTSAAGGVFTVRWGSIILERAQIEWSANEWFNVRAGLFLTPYGIWNVDHGSPTRIMLRPPLLVSVELFPERQTGVEMYGAVHVLPWTFTYSLYVSNGRAYGGIDFSDDKALGGRVVAKTRRPFPMQLGVSVFGGTTQFYAKMVGTDSAGRPALVRKETVDFGELAAGADLSLDIVALRIRTEFCLRRLVYEPGKREIYIGVPNANIVQSAGYLVVAYRLPWLGLEPLVLAEYLRQPTVAFGEVVLTGSAGLNIYFSTALTLRLQYCYSQVVDIQETTRDHSMNNLHILASRLIISY